MSNTRQITVARRALRLAHFCTDIYNSFIPTIMPVLIRQFGLSLSQAGFYSSFLPLVSAFFQPIFGLIADRMRTRTFIILGPIIAGIFVCLCAYVKEIWQLLPLLFIAALGIGAFHPPAVAMAGELAKRDTDHSPSVAKFIVAGTLGASVSSYLVYLLLGPENNIHNLIYAVPIGLIGGLAVAFTVPKMEIQVRKPFSPEVWKEKAKSLLLLVLIVISRSMVVISLMIFIPELLYLEASQSLKIGAIGILVFHTANALGSVVGSYTEKRFGPANIMIFSFIAGIPFIWFFLETKSLVLLFIGGFIVNMTQAINVSLAQKLIPENAATVSSLTMGFGWGIATLGMPLIGYFADIWGLASALKYNALIFLLISAVMVLILKSDRQYQKII